ncbi:MAG: hypothetical protein CL917_10810 [Deltaproteobacteria bacterium]|nr:hypothetical protein [Deltaproteobacteria bacterium]
MIVSSIPAQSVPTIRRLGSITGGAWVLVWLAFSFFFSSAILAEGEKSEGATVGSLPRAAISSGLHGIEYSSNQSCMDCHKKEAQAWRPSHHALAMQVATPETVLGDFEGAAFVENGVTTRFFRDGDRFRVKVEAPDGSSEDYRVAYTFGVHPLQQYLLEFPEGRLQALTVAFDVEEKAWYSLYPDEAIALDDAFSHTGRYQNWNAMCAECHSTAFEKNYDPQNDLYTSTWSEINVSCQSCHGPGARHVAWANSGADPDVSAAGLIHDLGEGSAELEIQTCAPCHALRHPVSSSDLTGRSFMDDFVPATLDEGLYHSDGQILGEVYVHGSFAQSRMHEAGVRCTDCHDPHSLELKADGDALCTRCHSLNPDSRFPQLVKRKYDDPDHHHHPQSSAGARCVSCHMPTQTYMGVDERHDHAFQVPRPDLAADLNLPDVCTGCHTDKTAAWAAGIVSEKYGPERTRGPHWAVALEAGRRGQASALVKLLALVPPGSAPDIVRATAVSLIGGQQGAEATPALVAASQDPSPQVRFAAAAVLSQRSLDDRLETLPSLLSDPVRAVRLQAGRGLVNFPSEILGEADTRLRDQALAEYQAVQASVSDLPSGRFNQAILFTEQGRYEEARSAYRKALEMDPRFTLAVANLAQLESALGNSKEAEKVLRMGIRAVPEEGELYYSLGLLLAERGDFKGASVPLGEAATLLPDRPRIQYNMGLAKQRVGDSESAAAAFLRAIELESTEPAFQRALTILYAQNEQWSKALIAARRLIQLDPRSASDRRLLAQIESAVGGRSASPEP